MFSLPPQGTFVLQQESESVNLIYTDYSSCTSFPEEVQFSQFFFDFESIFFFQQKMPHFSQPEATKYQGRSVICVLREKAIRSIKLKNRSNEDKGLFNPRLQIYYSDAKAESSWKISFNSYGSKKFTVQWFKRQRSRKKRDQLANISNGDQNRHTTI